MAYDPFSAPYHGFDRQSMAYDPFSAPPFSAPSGLAVGPGGWSPSPRAGVVVVDGQAYLAVREKGLTIEQIAADAGLPKETVTRIVSGASPVEVAARAGLRNETGIVQGTTLVLRLRRAAYTPAEEAAIEYEYVVANTRIAAGEEITRVGATSRLQVLP